MTPGEWGRCVAELRGAWPVHLRDEQWTSTWYRSLHGFHFKAVAWAVVRIVKMPLTFPPSLGVFREYVVAEERQRGLAPPRTELPETDAAALWRALNPGVPEPPPLTRAEALLRIRELGFVVNLGDGESRM